MIKFLHFAAFFVLIHCKLKAFKGIDLLVGLNEQLEALPLALGACDKHFLTS